MEDTQTYEKMAYDRISQINNSFQNQSVYIIGKDTRSKIIYVSFAILFPLLRFAPIAGAKNILPIRKKNRNFAAGITRFQLIN